MYSNPFRFLISSLSLPMFFLRIAERERWQNLPLTTTHQLDWIVTHNKSLHYFIATYSNSVYCFSVYSNRQSALLLEHWTEPPASTSASAPSLTTTSPLPPASVLAMPMAPLHAHLPVPNSSSITSLHLPARATSCHHSPGTWLALPPFVTPT